MYKSTIDICRLGLSVEETEMKRAQLLQDHQEEAAALKREKARQEAEKNEGEDRPEKKVCT